MAAKTKLWSVLKYQRKTDLWYPRREYLASLLTYFRAATSWSHVSWMLWPTAPQLRQPAPRRRTDSPAGRLAPQSWRLTSFLKCEFNSITELKRWFAITCRAWTRSLRHPKEAAEAWTCSCHAPSRLGQTRCIHTSSDCHTRLFRSKSMGNRITELSRLEETSEIT